jgi:hypothetical protein
MGHAWVSGLRRIEWRHFWRTGVRCRARCPDLWNKAFTVPTYPNRLYLPILALTHTSKR